MLASVAKINAIANRSCEVKACSDCSLVRLSTKSVYLKVIKVLHCRNLNSLTHTCQILQVVPGDVFPGNYILAIGPVRVAKGKNAPCERTSYSMHETVHMCNTTLRTLLSEKGTALLLEKDPSGLLMQQI